MDIKMKESSTKPFDYIQHLKNLESQNIPSDNVISSKSNMENMLNQIKKFCKNIQLDFQIEDINKNISDLEGIEKKNFNKAYDNFNPYVNKYKNINNQSNSDANGIKKTDLNVINNGVHHQKNFPPQIIFNHDTDDNNNKKNNNTNINGDNKNFLYPYMENIKPLNNETSKLNSEANLNMSNNEYQVLSNVMNKNNHNNPSNNTMNLTNSLPNYVPYNEQIHSNQNQNLEYISRSIFPNNYNYRSSETYSENQIRDNLADPNSLNGPIIRDPTETSNLYINCYEKNNRVNLLNNQYKNLPSNDPNYIRYIQENLRLNRTEHENRYTIDKIKNPNFENPRLNIENKGFIGNISDFNDTNLNKNRNSHNNILNEYINSSYNNENLGYKGQEKQIPDIFHKKNYLSMNNFKADINNFSSNTSDQNLMLNPRNFDQSSYDNYSFNNIIINNSNSNEKYSNDRFKNSEYPYIVNRGENEIKMNNNFYDTEIIRTLNNQLYINHNGNSNNNLYTSSSGNITNTVGNKFNIPGSKENNKEQNKMNHETNDKTFNNFSSAEVINYVRIFYQFCVQNNIDVTNNQLFKGYLDKFQKVLENYFSLNNNSNGSRDNTHNQ